MADKDLGLTIQYPPQPGPPQRLDDAYAAGKSARDWQQLLTDPTLNPQPAEGAGPAQGAGQGPTAASAAMTAFEEYRKQSVSDLLEGLGKALVPLPGEQKEGQSRLDLTMNSLRQAIIDGALGMASAPMMAAGAGAGQGLENLSPEMAKKEVLSADAAFTLRHIMNGAPDLKTVPKETQAQWRQPMTLREAVETGVAMGLPFIKGPVKGGARKLAASAVEAHTQAMEAMRGTVTRAGAPGIVEQGPAGQSAFRGRPRPTETSGPTTFVTAKGSRYVVREDGTTVRNKAARPEHPGQVGPQPPSEHTVYVDEAALNALGEFQTRGTGKKIITQAQDGRWGVKYTEGPNAGKFERRTMVAVSTSPAVGLHPVELWKGGSEVHFGNKITDVSGGESVPVPKPPEGAEARVNLDRIQATEGVKSTISDLNKFAGERLEEHRKRQSHDKVVAEAAGLRWSLEQILTHEPETILVDEAHAYRLRNFAEAAAEQYHSTGLKAEAGDPAALARLDEDFAVALKLSALDEGQARNLARGMEMRKEMAVGARVARSIGPQQILAISRKMGESSDDPLLRFRRTEALRADQRPSFFTQLYNGLRAGKDVLYGAWINALLSNPKTHAANMVGTGLIIAGDIPETYVAGWINRIARSPEGVQRMEAAIKVKSIAEGYQDGIRLMGQALRTGEEPFGRGKTSERHSSAMTAEAYGFSPDNPVGQTIDAMALMLNNPAAPTRLMMSEDAFMKGVAYRMELNALAMREALARGKTGRALEREVKMLQEQPMADMVTRAEDHALLYTLNQELGPAGRGFMQWMNWIPAGRVLFPFIQTPGNSLKWAGQRLPGFSWISPQNWSDVTGKSGPAARDKAIARVLIGNAVSVAIAYEVTNGTITGGGSKDKNLAALQRDPNTTTKPPYSICPAWTDQCFAYSRLDPVGSYIGAMADAVEMTAQIPDQETWQEWGAYVEALGIAAGQVSVSKNWLIGLSNVIDAIKAPDTSGGKLISSFARSIVPAAVREVARETDDNIIRDGRNISDAIKSGVPGLQGAVAPVRNPITGEKVQMPPGWGPDILSPVFVSKINASPVFREIQANHISIPPVPRSIGPDKTGPQLTEPKPSAGVPLTPWERDRWTVLMTHDVQVRGKTLYQALDALVTSERYQAWSKGPGGRRDNEIRGLVEVYRGIALERLKAESPKLRDALQARAEREVQALKNPPLQIPGLGR